MSSQIETKTIGKRLAAMFLGVALLSAGQPATQAARCYTKETATEAADCSTWGMQCQSPLTIAASGAAAQPCF